MANWFKHDWNARRDPKIKKLIRKYHSAGYGAYFQIIEILYECGGEMELDIEMLADELRESEEMVKSVIDDFELFNVSESNILTSSRVKKEFADMKKLSDKRKEATQARIEKYGQNSHKQPDF